MARNANSKKRRAPKTVPKLPDLFREWATVYESKLTRSGISDK
jgi:hypothetical protein